MENFIEYNPTKVHFGKNIVDTMHTLIDNYGKKALIVYGKESAKKYGFIDKISAQLELANIAFVEYGGIKPNPVISDVYKAVALCKKEKIDFIISVGGGSVVDSAKLIALAYANDLDAWEIMKHNHVITKTIPHIVVLTFAATGSGMNGITVIQNHEAQEKVAYFNKLLHPNESFIDPTFTVTVSKENTIYGIVDMISHCLEAYFAGGEADLSDRFVAATLKEIIDVSEELLRNLNDYELRARIMWASTVALNGTLYSGRRTSGDWGSHSIGHALSFLFDTPHGATLSVVFPAWLKHFKFELDDRLEKLGFLLTGNECSAEDTIEFFDNFFKKIEAPTVLNDLKIDNLKVAEIKKYLIHTKANGMNYQLTEDDYDSILDLMMMGD